MSEEKKSKIDLAENLLKQGKYKEAIDLCEGIHREYPDEDSVLLMLSWAYYDWGKTEEAEKYLNILFERELSRKVFTGFAFDELVRIYKAKKDFAKLVNICQRAAAAQPEDVGLLTELGSACLQAGDPLRACATFEKLIRMESDNPAFYGSWGEALFAAGFYEESEKAFLKASEIDSDKSDYYFFRLAGLFQRSERPEEAERILTQCIAVDSSNPHYYCSLGDCLVAQRRIDEALAAYGKAVQCDRAGAASYYHRLGSAFMKAREFLQASRAFQSAINLEPVRHYYLSLVSALREMGLQEQADLIVRELNQSDKH